MVLGSESKIEMPWKDLEKRRAHDRTPARRAARRRRWREYPAEYKVWYGMIRRCRERPDYKALGVCLRWRKSFPAFLSDMGPRPSARHSIERKRNREGYSPTNCKWALSREQQRNKRDNHIIWLDGRAQCVTAWAESCRIDPHVVFTRLYNGWSPKEALMTPVREYRR